MISAVTVLRMFFLQKGRATLKRDSKGEKVYEKVFFFKNNYSIKKSCVKSVMKF